MLVGIAAFLPFLFLITWPDGNLLRHDDLGGFYDAQAHALLSGHWDVDPSVVSIEGFTTPKGMQIYFGPVPAVARMPIAAFTHRFDGRLTRLSMLAAQALLIVALIRLTGWLELLLHGGRRGSRANLVWRGLAVFGIATSIPLVLASWALVYNEAILWGATLALCSFWLITAHLVTGRIRPLVGASVFAVLTVLTRASVGLAPLVAILALGADLLWRTWRTRSTPRSTSPGQEHSDQTPPMSASDRPTHPEPVTTRPAWTVLALGVGSLVLAGGLYVAVNHARFGTPLRVPFERQLSAAGLPTRRAALAANGGDLTNPAYLPTQALQLLNPTAIRLQRTFPFVALPHGEAPLVVPATFENRGASSSLLTSAPVPFLLGLWGLVALLSPRRRFPQLTHRREASLLVLGAAAGLGGVLTFADIAPRYLGDALPLLAISALVGASTLGHPRVPRERPARAGSHRAMVGVASVVTVLAVWVNGSFAMAVRYDQSPSLPFTDVRAWTSVQLRVARLLPGSYPPSWVGRELSRDAPAGSVAILGDCAALYRANDFGWNVIEGAPETHEGILTAAPRTAAAEAVLVHLQDERFRLQLVLRPLDGDQAELVLRVPVGGVEQDVPVRAMRWDRTHRPKIHLLVDPRSGQIRIMEGGDVLLGITARVPTGRLVPGPGVELERAPHRICPDLEHALTQSGR